MKKNVILILMLLVSTFAFALYGKLLPVNLEEPLTQLEVKRAYTVCHYINDASGDSVNYRFGAYAKNIGEADYNDDIALRVSSMSGTSAKWSKHINVPANDSVYFKIDFTVRKGERLELTMLDANGADISQLINLEIPDEDMEAPMYDRHRFATTYSRDENYNVSPYQGDSLVCGDVMMGYVLYGGIPSSMFLWPQQTDFEMRLNDVYGLNTLQIRFDDIQESIEDIEVTDQGARIKSGMKTMLRGGEYEYRVRINGFGVDVRSTEIMHDVPTLRFDSPGSNVVKGKDILYDAIYNTGYPYTEELVGKTYDSKIDVTYIKPVDGHDPDTLRNFCTEQHATKFDVAICPLLAGVDTFKFKMEKPDFGEYLLDFSSAYRDGKRNHTMSYSVNDTLRSEFDFLKNTFVQDSDTLATFHYKLDKKWPYILNLMDDSIPSVHIVASCIRSLNEMTGADSIRCDSLWALQTHADSLVAQAIVDSLVRDVDVIGDSILIPIGKNMPLDIEGDFTFSVNRCVPDDSVLVKIYIKNIETEDITLKYNIFVSSVTDGISDLDDSSQPASDAMAVRKYNLQGLPVTDNYRGIVISRGKAYLNK